MKARTAFVILVCSVGMTGCGTDFGPGDGNDGGSDALVPDDTEESDGPLGDSFDDGSLDADPPADGAGDERRLDVGPADIVRDASRSDSSAIDAGPSDAPVDAVFTDGAMGDGNDADVRCDPETDQAFCARLGKNCEMVMEADNCGVLRGANCGTCAGGMGCVDSVCKTPVCSSFIYSSAAYPPFSLAGTADFAIATSSAGETILYGQSAQPDCAMAVTYLADEITPGSRTYTSRSITSWLDAHGIVGQALTGDGLGLITLSNDFKSFQIARRSALQLLDFGAPSAVDFKAVNAMLAGTTGLLRGGVISADGLEFCYTIFSGGIAVDGIYCSKRAAVSSRFATGARLVAVDASYTDVTGISSDRLTLFVFKPWAGFVFTRNSTSAEFSNPNGANPPPQLAGWQHKPLADCATLVGTHAPGGGCANQDIIFQTRR
jgi:hypothetical protein